METTCLNSRLQKERVLVGNYSEYSIVIRFPNMVKHRIIGGFAKRAHPARARYLNVNLAWRNRDLQPGGKEIKGGGRGGGGEGGEK